MILSYWAVKRPITTLMFFLGLCLLGAISWFKLPQDLFPQISYPQVTIVTSYGNAAPIEIENLVTKPIEEAISTVSNLKKIKSISREGLSLVTAEFGWNSKMDFAALAIRQKIDLIKEKLPREAKEPIVKKINPFELPVLILSLQGNMKDDKLLAYAKKYLKESLSKVEGVASVIIQGGKEYEIFVDVNANMLKARNIDIRKIDRILKDTNLNYPAGTTKEPYYEYLIRTQGEFETIREIGETILDVDTKAVSSEQLNSRSPLGVVKLKDIATIKKEYTDTTNISRFNGNDNILISVFKQSDANTISTVKRLFDKLGSIELSENHPVSVDVVYDKSVFIKNAIQGVKSAGVFGGFLAFLVLLFFLQSFSAAIIVAITIPVSILIAFISMFAGGITINIMSLGGLALGVGMLVDNSIVVIENITRKKESGDSPFNAAIIGTSQVWTAIFASTLTTIAVFLPMIFITGIEGQLFKELAYTVTFSLLASMLVSLTLIPRFAGKSSLIYKKPYIKSFENITISLENFYYGSLNVFLKSKGFFLTITFLIFIVSIFIATNIPQEMLPKIDEGQFAINLTMPAGSRLEITDKEVKKIENILLSDKNVKNISANIGSGTKDAKEGGQLLGSHQGYLTVVLKNERAIKTEEFIHKLEKKLKNVISKKASLEFKMSSSGIASAIFFESPVTIQIHSKDNTKLGNKSKSIYEHLKEIPGIINLKTTLTDPSPETKIIIDKQLASKSGLSASDISKAAQTAIKGTIATNFKDKKGTETPIRIRLQEQYRDNIKKIENIPVWAFEDTSVFLGDVVKIEQGVGPTEILRIDQLKVVRITADIPKEYNKNEIIKNVKSLLEDLSGDKDITIELIEKTNEQRGAVRELIMTLLLSIIVVYMIMAAQFESLIQPLLIMVTVPLGIIGVIIALFLTGTTFNVISVLGIILLGGIVVNNGIVLIEYINQNVEKQKDLTQAVIQACQVRFRPIIMTTLTTILGLMPLALGFGEGAELRAPMAISVMGGLLVSTALTLLVLPSLYLIVMDKNKLKNK